MPIKRRLRISAPAETRVFLVSSDYAAIEDILVERREFFLGKNPVVAHIERKLETVKRAREIAEAKAAKPIAVSTKRRRIRLPGDYRVAEPAKIVLTKRLEDMHRHALIALAESLNIEHHGLDLRVMATSLLITLIRKTGRVECP